jgi:Uma2 family endonuclease
MSLSLRNPPGPMTVEEFLRWSPRDDRRYELFGGEPVAMNPPSWPHSVLAATMVSLIRRFLTGHPHCRVGVEAGVTLPGRNKDYFQADLIVRCRDPEAGDESDPRLIVEIQSPSTEKYDRQAKLALYRTIPSVREICLVCQDRALIEVLRRSEGDTWLSLLAIGPEATVRLDSVGLEAPLGEIYADIEFPEADRPDEDPA